MVFVASYPVSFLLIFFSPLQDSQCISLVSVSASNIFFQRDNCRGLVEYSPLLINQVQTISSADVGMHSVNKIVWMVVIQVDRVTFCH